MNASPSHSDHQSQPARSYKPFRIQGGLAVGAGFAIGMFMFYTDSLGLEGYLATIAAQLAHLGSPLPPFVLAVVVAFLAALLHSQERLSPAPAAHHRYSILIGSLLGVVWCWALLEVFSRWMGKDAYAEWVAANWLHLPPQVGLAVGLSFAGAGWVAARHDRRVVEDQARVRRVSQ